MSLVAVRTRPASQSSCGAVRDPTQVLWNRRSVATRARTSTTTAWRSPNAAATSTASSVVASRCDYSHRPTEVRARQVAAAVAAAAADRTRQAAAAAATADTDTADSLPVSKIGILSAEFGPEALQALRSAAAAASRAHAAAAESCTQKMLLPGPTADEPEPKRQPVLVTQQHLMTALLQQHPEAVEFIAQHVMLDLRSGDPQPEPSVLIREKLACSGLSISQGSGEAADKTSLDEVPDELQLSAQVLHVLNGALTSTRQQGQPVVLWPSLMWGLMQCSNAHTAYEQILGAKLLSADVRDQVCSMVRQQAAKPIAVPQNVGNSSVQCWMDVTLDQALATARQSLHRGRTTAKQLYGWTHRGRTWTTITTSVTDQVKAARKAAVAISSAAEAGYQPAAAWLNAAWELIKNATRAAFGDEHADHHQLVQQCKVAAELASAAYNSVVHLKFTSPHMFGVLDKVAAAKCLTPLSDAWLQAVIAAEADAAHSNDNLQCNAYLSALETADISRIADQEFSPPVQLITGFLPVILRDRQYLGMSGTSPRTMLHTATHTSAGLCELLVRCMPHASIADICAIADHASAFWKKSSPPQQEQWLKVLESCVQRICSEVQEVISTAELLRVYTATFSLPTGQAVDTKLQLTQLLVARVKALPSLKIVQEIGGNCADLMNDYSHFWPKLSATAREEQLAGISKDDEDHMDPETAAHTLSLLSVIGLSHKGTKVMTMQQVDALLQTLTAQQREHEDFWGHLPADLLDQVLLPAVEAAANTTAPDVAHGNSSDAATAAHLAGLLHTVQQLPLYFSVEKMNELVVNLPIWLPLMQPDQLGQVIRFVAKQQLQLGRDNDGLNFSKDVLWQNLDSHMPSRSAQGSVDLDQTMSEVYYVTGVDAAGRALIAGAAAGTLKALHNSKLSATSGSAQQLVDIAQALGACKLPVEVLTEFDDVMDVLAYHVGCSLEAFTVDQLPVLLWAFAIKQPSLAASRHVIVALLQRVQSPECTQLFREKEA